MILMELWPWFKKYIKPESTNIIELEWQLKHESIYGSFYPLFIMPSIAESHQNGLVYHKLCCEVL